VLEIIVKINEREIDRFQLVNTAQLHLGQHIYQLYHPNCKSVCITHTRSQGYRPLVIKALEHFETLGTKTHPKQQEED